MEKVVGGRDESLLVYSAWDTICRSVSPAFDGGNKAGV